MNTQEIYMTSHFVHSIASLPWQTQCFYDARTIGLCLEVRAKQEKSWFFIYTMNGEQKRMKLGDYPVMKMTHARNLAKEALGILVSGMDPIEVREKEKFEYCMGWEKHYQEALQRHEMELHDFRQIHAQNSCLYADYLKTQNS